MVVIIGTAIMAGIIGTTITTIIIGIGHGLLAIPGTTVTGKAPSRPTEPGALLRRFSLGAIEAAIFSQRSSFKRNEPAAMEAGRYMSNKALLSIPAIIEAMTVNR